MTGRSFVCIITMLAVATAGCTGMHKVPTMPSTAGSVMWAVKAGDLVRVQMRDGGSAEFTVQSVTPDAIVAANGTTYAQADIVSVERRGISGGKTAGAVGAGLGILVAIVFVAGGLALISALNGGGY